MSLADSLDLGATLVPTAPCLMNDDTTLSYAETQGLSRSIAASLRASDVSSGQTIGVLSSNEPLALTCIFGASRAGAAWTLIDPMEATVAELIAGLDACSVLLCHTAEVELARALQPLLPRLHTLVCLDGRADGVMGWGEFLTLGFTRSAVVPAAPSAATGLDERSLEDRPVFLALGPLTEANAGRWQPVLAQGGRIVMRSRARARAFSVMEA